MEKSNLRERVLLGMPITKEEEAFFLLFVASYEEAMIYLDIKRWRK